jgi:hypothetical protein
MRFPSAAGRLEAGKLHLPPWGFWFERRDANAAGARKGK